MHHSHLYSKKITLYSLTALSLLFSTSSIANNSPWSENASHQVSAYNVSFTGGVSSSQSDQLYFEFYDQPGCNGGDEQTGSPTTIGTVGDFTMTFNQSSAYSFNAGAAWQIDQDVTNNASATKSIQIQPKYNNTFNVWGGATCSEVDCSVGVQCIASNSVTTTLISN